MFVGIVVFILWCLIGILVLAGLARAHLFPPKLKLEPDETLLVRDHARYAFDRPNGLDPRPRPRGVLFLTDRRLTWRPLITRTVFGSTEFSISLSVIRSVQQGTDLIGLSPSLLVTTDAGLHVFWLGRNSEDGYDIIQKFWLPRLRGLGLLSQLGSSETSPR